MRQEEGVRKSRCRGDVRLGSKGDSVGQFGRARMSLKLASPELRNKRTLRITPPANSQTLDFSVALHVAHH